jgi:hypothetical protein
LIHCFVGCWVGSFKTPLDVESLWCRRSAH